MPISIDDRIRIARLDLSRLQKEREIIVARWERELQQAEKREFSPARVEEIRKRLSISKGVFERSIARSEARVAELEVQLTARESETRQKAQAGLEKLRSKALDAWMKNGGEESSFDEVWDGMQTELLKQKTIDSLSPKAARTSL